MWKYLENYILRGNGDIKKMIDKNYCMSSYLAFRYVIDDDKNFYPSMKHQVYNLIPEDKRILVNDEHDVDRELRKQFESLKGKKKGMLLSGGMDSACLASYLEGADAYTFRFLGGKFQSDELERAKQFAEKYNLTLHYVDIDWITVVEHLEDVMKHKGAPVHSIEPQIYQAALQAKKDGIEVMVIGDAADYVFGGMDGLHAKDWTYDEFKNRCIYVNPEEVLKDPFDMDYAFKKYKTEENGIDFISLMHEYTDIESYASYENAFETAGMHFLDPYEVLKMSKPLDLKRVRNGESKYIVRALFKMKYPEIQVPQKNPMPRPVDEYFKTWEGPTRPEFRNDIDMSKYTGNQKWLMYCLEKFLDMNE